MKRALLALMLFGAYGVGATQAQVKKADAKEAHKDAHKEAHIGIGVEAVSPAIYSQLPGVLSKGQGVMIDQVERNSPASKAGLQANDILLTYADQKLYAPEQLTKLVHGDKPGHEISLGFLRGGKTMSCKVMLGEAEPASDSERSRVFRLFADDGLRRMFDESKSKNGASSWESFDELRLTRMDANKWRAIIDYRTKDGKKQERTFTGTREELRKNIMAEKDLPANERVHLLRALNLHDPVFEFHFPPLGSIGPEFNDRP